MLCDCFKRPSSDTGSRDDRSPAAGCGAAASTLPPTHRRLYEEIYRLQSNVGVALGPRPTPTNIAAPPPKHLVRLNVYHLIEEATNLKLLRYGFGVFHTGVVVYGIEWSFGESVEGQETGLFCVAPGNAAGVVFKTIDLGYTDLSPEQVDTLLHRLENEWKSADYHVLNRNCNHFAERFCALLSTLERLEIPPWCNRSARWSDKVVPKNLATWVLRRMDGSEAPPLATTVGTRSQIGELPLSVVPPNWYKTAALRRERRFAIQIPSARPAAPRREPPVARGNTAALLSTGHLQATPPPPGKADVSSPDVATAHRGGRTQVEAGTAMQSEAFGPATPIAPPLSRAVKMPDFNKHLTNGSARTGNGSITTGLSASNTPATTGSGNVGSERALAGAPADGGAGHRNPVVASFSTFQNNRVEVAPAGRSWTKLDMHDLMHAATPVPPTAAQGSMLQPMEPKGSVDVEAEASPVFHGDVELGSLNENDEGGELPTLMDDDNTKKEEKQEGAAFPRDTGLDHTARSAASEAPPALARSAGTISPLALTESAPASPPPRGGQAAQTPPPLADDPTPVVAKAGCKVGPSSCAAFDQQCRADDDAFLSVNATQHSTAIDLLDGAAALGLSAEHIPLAELSVLQPDVGDDDVVQGQLLEAAAADDDMTLQNIETELHTVQRAEGNDATSPPHVGMLLGVTRTASFTRPSVASVYSTPSGSPHSTIEADNDTNGGMRTEDATVFTDAVEQRCR